jgi:hypothetical protein
MQVYSHPRLSFDGNSRDNASECIAGGAIRVAHALASTTTEAGSAVLRRFCHDTAVVLHLDRKRHEQSILHEPEGRSGGSISHEC